MSKKILVIEDRIDTANMLKFALDKSGYVAMTSTDGEKGLKIISEKNVDLVILDLMLPGMSGRGVLEMIRSDKENKKLKVIILTAAKISEKEQKAFLKAGANNFLLKPIRIEELTAVINETLKK